MTGVLVLDRAVDVHQRLLDAGIDNALGGALALAFYTDDPRGTQDIDVNVSLPAARAVAALKALPPEVPWDDTTLATIARDGQVRIHWPVHGEIAMPLDLFFAVDEFHQQLRRRTEPVEIQGRPVRIVSATDLAVLKALFDRPKDWPDIMAMIAASDSRVDGPEAVRWVGRIVGPDDPRTVRLRALFGSR